MDMLMGTDIGLDVAVGTGTVQVTAINMGMVLGMGLDMLLEIKKVEVLDNVYS